MTTSIIGLGLIGGSFAKDLRAAGFASELLGSDASPEHAQRALQLGLGDGRIHQLPQLAHDHRDHLADALVGAAGVDAEQAGVAERTVESGAVDFLEKPLSTDKLLLTVENVLKLKRLEDENRELRQRVGKHSIVYSGEAMQRLMAQVERVAASETRVCIMGETGTGKELIARALHQRSPRRDGPFVTLNCAAVPGELIESELFGHEKGSFTGAASRHIGKFEQAHRGTLFLDEIGDMPMAMQAKLLRVLEERQVERVGGDRPVPVDVRVIVATHRDLDKLVTAGGFRPDLYHRIYVFPLLLPPLRERVEDIPPLVAHFAAEVAEQNGWKPKTFEPEAIQELQRHGWPGNVRELRNVVERLLLLADGPVDRAAVRLALPQVVGQITGLPGPNGPLSQRLDSFEREQILAELKRHNQRMSDTAKALGLERSHLYKKCQALGIDLRALRKNAEA